MKYSVISVVNNSYKKFAFVFIKSAIENLNLENIHEICLLNTGLNNNDVQKIISLNSKIKIIPSKEVYNSKQSWDYGWQQNVLLKTNFAFSYIQDNNIPTCMVDIDSMFINDISDIMKTQGDLVLCDRSDLWGGMPFIASFVGFLNPLKSLDFINEWREKMNYMFEKGFKTKETPALNELVKSNKKYNILAASHKMVGLYKPNLYIEQTRILHFKGAGDSENKPLDEAINIRFNRFTSYQHKIKTYLQNV